MKNKILKTPLAAAISSVVVSVLTPTVASADIDPFAVSELSTGYMQVAQGYTVVPWEGEKASEASCGEGKCGEGKCGENDKKAEEATEKATEAKCGEGKCGDMMDGDKMKKGLEKSCGSMMKGKEGSCGVMDDDKDSKSGGMDMGGKDGEMSCGAMMEKMKKMKGMMKDGEMTCGGMMEKMKDMKAGMDMGGKGDMDMGDKKSGEMSCGAMMDK
ncbi:MAG: hypothetical protein KAH20_10045 [Methylococcales bacterium]|nr:hypothetical protein [Methylococcales bacterium]